MIRTTIVVIADDADAPDPRGSVVWYRRVIETADVTELGRFGQELGAFVDKYTADKQD